MVPWLGQLWSGLEISGVGTRGGKDKDRNPGGVQSPGLKNRKPRQIPTRPTLLQCPGCCLDRGAHSLTPQRLLQAALLCSSGTAKSSSQLFPPRAPQRVPRTLEYLFTVH